MNELKEIEKEKIQLEYVLIDNEGYYKITNSDLLRPFFMTIVSDSNHWMFISSNGGVSAGRKDSDNALFPYYTDDKITESADITGSKSIFQVKHEGKTKIWEPFSNRYTGVYNYTRNLYKNEYGNKIIFEEVNHDLDLTYQYQWSSSNIFGFVKKTKLINQGASTLDIEVLDGLQNIIPCGVSTEIQGIRSNLVDAYKRSELIPETGLGVFALSAIIVDRAEPSEALKANTVWSIGLDNTKHLLSSMQLDTFRNCEALHQEEDIKAEKGAYFVSTDIQLSPGSEKDWLIIANVNQGPSAVAETSHTIKDSNLRDRVQQDIDKGTEHLIELGAASDAMQLTADERRNTRHYANVLFNIMRGGIFDDNYKIEKWDFENYLSKASSVVYKNQRALLNTLNDSFSVTELHALAHNSDDKDLQRLALEYMPLKFSRRHGDPSRPWNKFSINTRSEIDGSKILDYEGNWRDIFQNWEALAHSYPEFIESMVHKFLNATTFDGYNPYRVTKDGFDWEVIEEHDPWSYIGYWGDHQIIYLLKFLEFIENHYPKRLVELFDKDLFVYANVPYIIKSYQDILKNPKDTIAFDYESDLKISEERSEIGADGALLKNATDSIHRVNFIEKILATVLAKMSNFIPEAGIWMNTQRPEWNDANNALVGNGVSMVTLYYLRRFLKFFQQLISSSDLMQVEVSQELTSFFEGVHNTLDTNKSKLTNNVNDQDRKQILDGLGQAASDYRLCIYGKTFSGNKASLELNQLHQFIEVSLEYLEHSINANKRTDSLYHAYNLVPSLMKQTIVTHDISHISGPALPVEENSKSKRVWRGQLCAAINCNNRRGKPALTCHFSDSLRTQLGM